MKPPAHQSGLVFVFLGNAGEIREMVSKYGPVTEFAITEPITKLVAR